MAKLSSKTIKVIQKHMDSALDNLAKKFLPSIVAAPVEFLDNILEKAALNYLNNKLGAKIPDSLNATLDALAVALDKKDYASAEQLIAKGLSDEIKTPLVDGTPEENAIYSYLIGTIFNLLGLKVSVSK